MNWWKNLCEKKQKLQFIVCLTCRIRHMLQYPKIDDRIKEFELRHPGHNLSWFVVKNPDDYLALLTLAPNADIKEAFGSTTPIVIFLASKAEGTARESTALDNGSDLFLDVIAHVNIKLQTGVPASEKAIKIYGYASEDGTDYTDNASGTNADIALRSPTNLKLVDIINTPDSGGLTYKSHAFSIAKIVSTGMPRKWGIVVENKTNITFSATEGDHKKQFSGIFATSI